MPFIRRHSYNIILNPAPAPRALPNSLLEYCSIITPNENEFTAMFKCRYPLQGKQLLEKMKARDLCNIVLTQGARGALWHFIYRDAKDVVPEPFYEDADGVRWNVTGPAGPDKLGANHYRPPKVNAIDCVGAGDCFNGCLATQLARAEWLDTAIPFAVAAAAIQVTRRGAQAAMPYRHEILKMLKRMKTKK
jgi:ribokinase